MKEEIDWTGFEVPERRKNLKIKSNALWILRNLTINNREHPRLNQVIDEVSAIVSKGGRHGPDESQ
jgi:hypothetical protein